MVSEEAKAMELEIQTLNMSKHIFKIKHSNTEVVTLRQNKNNQLPCSFLTAAIFHILPLKQFSIIKLKRIQIIV